MIDYCKAEYPELSFQHSDARDLSAFKDNSFDFVMFSYNGIDYISDADRIKVFMEIKRILKKNGVLVFSTHNLNFKKIELRPSLEASLNPINFIRNFINYIKQVKNNYKNKKEQTLNNDYSILNDSGNGFSLLTYYITREKQIEQLNKINLKLLEIFDMNGQTLKSNIDDSNNAWLYYVVQKC